MSNRPPTCVAYVEDVEDGDSSVEGVEGPEGIKGTRRYARSEVQVPVSPNKERPNTGKSRGDRRTSYRKSDSRSPSNGPSDDEEPRRRPSREEREARQYEREQREKERRRKDRKMREAAEQQQQQQQRKARAEAKAAKEREAKPVRKTRPTSLTQSRTEPVVQQYRRGHVEDPSCYGVQQPAPAPARPRAHTRPNSFYPGQTPMPPIAHAGWHQSQPQSPFPVGSFPPPPPHMYPGGTPAGAVTGLSASPGQTPGFFDMTSQQANAHLKNRFERPASSMGFRQQGPPSAFDLPQEEYEDEPDPRMQMQRRPSRTKKQMEDDRRRMPPPEFIRPKSAMPPPTTPFRPPPQQTLVRQKTRTPSRPSISSGRSRVGFADQPEYDDDDYGSHADLFNDMSPDPVHFDRRTALTRTRRGSVAYEQPGVDIVTSGPRSRPNSFYGHDRALGSGGVSLEDDKYLSALAYQDDMNGGPGVPLTAETLRKANNAGASSSRSSGSRDESEFRRSNTTGITRSSSSDTDNVTIKVSGASLVRVPGASIQCAEGSEITFSSRPGGGSRVGSDRASTIYQLEDIRGPMEYKALPYRARTPSQSETHSRGYAPSHAPYDPTFAVEDYIF